MVPIVLLLISFVIANFTKADARLNIEGTTITNTNYKESFSKEIIQDGMKLLLYSKYPKSINNKLNIYSECLNFVDEMKKYRNNIDEYSQHVKSYCENIFGGPDKSETLQNVCQYIIEVITEDIKNEFLPDYINEDLCNLFK